jgi:D-glycero-beta-D-manno-heptose 1-phosphate adenylyltransferase
MDKSEFYKQKLLDADSLSRTLARWQLQSKKIVFTNGCFDILHAGHVDYLSKAAACGDVLIIGMNSDASVRRLKGTKRPLNHENARALLLAALSFVDAVVIFDEDTPRELIGVVQPDVLVKGSDYKPEEIAGHDIVAAKGGEIITIDLLEGYSTSLLEQKIIGLHPTE